MSESSQTGERIMRGIAVSDGVCVGKVLNLGSHEDVDVPRVAITDEAVADHLQRLEQAIISTRCEILDVQQKVSQHIRAQDASIFDAHLLVLEDPALVDEVTRLIQEEKVNVEYAFQTAARNYAAALSAIDDEFFRERAADMRDVLQRVLNNLSGRKDDVDLAHLPEPCVVVSHDLSPSHTAMLDKSMVRGFATDVGGRTSHTAILARELRIPAVVGLGEISGQLQSGQSVLLDGYNGLVILNPTEQTLFEYGQLARKQASFDEKLRESRDKATITLDGAPIVLSCNIGASAEVHNVMECGGEGVGLFRTEFLFLNREDPPTEEEQFIEYKAAVDAAKSHPVIIRTLDLGGDKLPEHIRLPSENNPFLGWRAIRICLQNKELFKTQLRAILRASAFGNVKVMYPMISNVDEVDQANAILNECRSELRAEGVPFNENMDVGVMIEVPSAVMVADALAKRVKFFSLGTNDLIQYSMAADRLNSRIAHLYKPTHPGILRLIKMAADAAHANGIWIGVCGEMASDPALTPLLLGLGLDEISVASGSVLKLKYLIRLLKKSEVAELTAFALQCESADEILARSKNLAQMAAPGLFDNEMKQVSNTTATPPA